MFTTVEKVAWTTSATIFVAGTVVQTTTQICRALFVTVKVDLRIRVMFYGSLNFGQRLAKKQSINWF